MATFKLYMSSSCFFDNSPKHRLSAPKSPPQLRCLPMISFITKQIGARIDVFMHQIPEHVEAFPLGEVVRHGIAVAALPPDCAQRVSDRIPAELLSDAAHLICFFHRRLLYWREEPIPLPTMFLSRERAFLTRLPRKIKISSIGHRSRRFVRRQSAFFERLILLCGRLLPPPFGKLGVEFAFGVHRDGDGCNVNPFVIVHHRSLLRYIRREAAIEIFCEPSIAIR